MPKKVSWMPDQKIEITGKELEDLLRLGELFLIPAATMSEDTRAKIYFQFLDAKDKIVDRMVATEVATVED